MRRLVESVFQTADQPDLVEVLFYIDDDDELSIWEAQRLFSLYNPRVKFLVGERITMNDCHNYLYELSEGKLVMYAGDDIVFRDKGWDSLILESFAKYPDEIVLLGGHDGYNGDIITHGFLSRKWVDTVGYVVPWGFVGDYADVVISDIARILDRYVRVNTYIEHLHYAAGKGTIDKTMQEKLQRSYNVKVPAQQVYFNRKNETLQDAAKLQRVIDEYTK